MNFISKTPLLTSAIALALSPLSFAIDGTASLPDITVTAEFRESSLQQTAVSATVITEEVIAQQHAQHLEQLLGLAPNINFSSGASRGRFVQIRGIGERSQFVEPLSASVGILIDGIDFTGIGAAATTLDLQQVEILRGPQGTLYGANALAGLINLKSNAPTEDLHGGVSATLGDYDTKTVNAYLSGPLNSSLAYRIAAETHSSDGFIVNDFLGRDDTSNIDESTLRAKLAWQANEHLNVDFTALYVDVDNGYDDFSLVNTRHTLSDNPGQDRQESLAFSTQATWSKPEAFDLVALVSHANSELEYGYDEDWTFDGICAGQACDGWAYVSEDNYLRDNVNSTLDLRFVSKAEVNSIGWVAGIYYRDQDVDLVREYNDRANFISEFKTKNTALYGQVDFPLTDTLSLVTGLRFEQRDADYKDNNMAAFSPSENLWGGKISLEHLDSDGRLIYGLISRGYKAGGFNADPELASSETNFDTEIMWNYEIGLKDQFLDNTLQVQVALFYQDRDDIQVKQSRIIPREGDQCPCDFIDFTNNAAKGSNYGLEASVNYLMSERVSLLASFGILETEFKNYLSYEHAEANKEDGIAYSMDGRDQPHAPGYQFALGLNVVLTESWDAKVSLEGKDDFYFSNSHNEQSDAYELINASLNYQNQQWNFEIWGRNLSDEDVKVRGFNFPNDPRTFYAPATFTQLGEPRMIGVSGGYQF